MGARGRKIEESDKKKILGLVKEACDSGARKEKAAEVAGVDERTLQRWEKNGLKDKRKGSRAKPKNKLSDSEVKKIENVLVSKEFKDMSPGRIVVELADKGTYIGSESTMYRILKKSKMNKHRSSSKPSEDNRPKGYVATGANQIFSWDITYLPSKVKGMYFYLYMIMDIYSRKIVGWQAYDRQCGELAADLLKATCENEKISEDMGVILHSDNGKPMKSCTMLAMLEDLGVIPSFSRPRVSDDNPFSESLFKTLKYRPEYPEKPFDNLLEAREWVETFVCWYNNEHKHSGIKFVTPADRHNGKHIEILNKRKETYRAAKLEHPERWTGKIRNWEPAEEVHLNKTACMVKKDLKKAA